MMDFLEDHSFKIGEIKFQTIKVLSDLFTLNAQNGYILGKPKRFIEKYCEHLVPSQYANIVELGIFRGGSTVFFNEYFKPKMLVAIDFSPQRQADLDTYIAEHGLHDKLSAYYGVNQADVPRLRRIWQQDFKGAELDLVIDDASHFLEESRTSFNTLFPMLRTGGAYVIEDWSWAHIAQTDASITKNFSGKKPLSNLIIEIMLASVSTPGLIDELIVTDGFVIVRKGALHIDQDFDVSRHCYLLGQPMQGYQPIPTP